VIDLEGKDEATKSENRCIAIVLVLFSFYLHSGKCILYALHPIGSFDDTGSEGK
jgi:hypothetical protein